MTDNEQDAREKQTYASFGGRKPQLLGDERDALITRLRDDLDRVTRERDALLETPGGYWWPSWRKMIDAMVKPGPRCRDCADYDGRCGGDGPPCDPTEHAIENYRKSLARAEAAEAALAKRDEEVARYKRKLMQGEAILAGWTRIDRIKLAAGEMTAQEARTALAVAKAIAASVRSAIAAEPEALSKEPTNAE